MSCHATSKRSACSLIFILLRNQWQYGHGMAKVVSKSNKQRIKTQIPWITWLFVCLFFMYTRLFQSTKRSPVLRDVFFSIWMHHLAYGNYGRVRCHSNTQCCYYLRLCKKPQSSQAFHVPGNQPGNCRYVSWGHHWNHVFRYHWSSMQHLDL